MGTLAPLAEIGGTRFTLNYPTVHLPTHVTSLAHLRIPYALFAVALIALGAVRDEAIPHFLSANGTDYCGVFGSVMHDRLVDFSLNSIAESVCRTPRYCSS